MAAEFLKGYGIDLQHEMSKVQFEDVQDAGNLKASLPNHQTSTTSLIQGVRLPSKDRDTLWDISLSEGRVKAVYPHDDKNNVQVPFQHENLDAKGFFLGPSLCHPHIHLDKCFLLSHYKYSDLEIATGGFEEASILTSKAKSRFDEDDLLQRGRWLISESIAAGVTCMRAFVEVDSIVRFKCLDAGLKLKEEFKACCEIQLCVFGQEPIFSSGKNLLEGATLLEEAVKRDGVDALGSTPYTEETEALMLANIDWTMTIALRHRKHLDLHLDYNLDPTVTPLVIHVIEIAKRTNWTAVSGNKTIVLGHCTRLTLFKDEEWRQLRSNIGDLPIFFIGLPTSDLYMMGKPNENQSDGQRVRGTLHIPDMIQQYGFNGAIGINNISNPFTPQGNCDPMSIASLGVGLYHAGRKTDTQILYVRKNLILIEYSLHLTRNSLFALTLLPT